MVLNLMNNSQGSNKNNSNDNLKNIVKLVCILAGMVFLFKLWYNQMDNKKELEAPEGEMITVEDVNILLNALNLDIQVGEDIAADITDTVSGDSLSLRKDNELNAGALILQTSAGDSDTGRNTSTDSAVNTDSNINADSALLTYEQYKKIYEYIEGADKDMPDFAGKYEDFHTVLKEDWYQAFRLMLAYYDTESSIWKTTLFILKTDAEENKLYTPENEYSYLSSSFAESEFNKEEVYVKNDKLLTSIRVLDERTILENVWVMEVSDDESDSDNVYVLECFYRQLNFNVITSESAQREQVADLTFEGGELTKVEGKDEKIRGRLLSVSDDTMEIEGCGSYETEEGLEVYKLYGTLQTQKKSDLMIGYDYTDFVVKNNKICACLVSREGEIDQIRVLLKNTGNGSYYYDEAKVTVDGEETLVKADEMDTGERRSFKSNALTDKVKMEIDSVNKADNLYRGTLEFYKTKEGMAIINELPLEEYLYAVVPSEMPAYYPMEALKAQAVCARTYAYRHILHAGLAGFGAHLDDTTSYQVYHNIDENAATTTAVKETDGMMLYYQDELAENYYYSTSCGYGTDTTIWKTEAAQHIPYIKGVKIAGEEDRNNSPAADELKEEEKFAAYIKSVDETDFESGEAWYRWRYEVEELDADKMLERIKERYKANASLVLTKKDGADGDYYVSEPVKSLGKIKDISISKRGAGGIADELTITGSKAVIKIISEYNIRRILCDGEGKVIRQDGSSVAASTLLPSAFLIIETGKSGEDVIGYSVIGGGYGHGVGMSQNAAKEIGSLGYGYQEILGVFFADCEVRK